MTCEQLEELIEIENKLRPRCLDIMAMDHTCLNFGNYRMSKDEQDEILKEFGISHPNKYLVESFAGTSCFYVNEQLRERDIVDPDEYVHLYEIYLNEILDNIEPCNKSTVWRWHISDERIDFLTRHKGCVIQFPEFKSTSLKFKSDCNALKIFTSNHSNGKMIFKHLGNGKGEAEKEVLFKSLTKFRVGERKGQVLELEELEDQNEIVEFFLHFNFEEAERHYTQRSVEIKFGEFDKEQPKF